MVSNKWQWCAAWVIAATWCGAEGELRAQCQTQRLFPADGAAGDQFGTSVDIDGDRIIVGTPLHNGTIGAAYVYVRTPTGWLQEAKLTDVQVLPGDDFARTVSISGDFVAVSASKTERGSAHDVGRVHVFSRLGPAWMAETLSAPVFLLAGSEFGTSVSVSGDAVLIGAPFTDGVTLPTGAGNSGSAFIFRRNAATGVWSQEAMLTASDAQELDLFGATVALHGDTAFVTAFGDKDPTISQNNTIGSVYVFRKQQESWVQAQKLVPSNAAAQALLGPRNFGRSLSTDGTVLLVGERSGQSAYVFRFNGTAWIEEAILKKPVGNTATDQFGHSVAIHGDFAFVGAMLDDDNGLSNSGTVFAFRRVGGVWINQALIYADLPLAQARLGTSMSIDQGDLVVGAIETGGGLSGSVHVFATAAANDCDFNGQSDICEIGDDPTLDADGNGTLDVCDCALDAECNDGLDCTVDTCNPVTHVCDFTLMPAVCRINGVCHASGAFNPVVHCQVCDPTQSTSAWSVDQDGTVCDPPATQCMLGGFCQSGQCVQVPKPVGASCGNPNSSDCDDPDICNGAGTCFANPKPNNFPCTDNGQFCDGTERCLLGQCTSTGINPCDAATVTPICDEELDRCVECLQNAQCVDSNECTADVCDADGLCQNGPAPAGTFCGSAGDTLCDGRDTCNGAGACQTNLAPLGTLCGSITNTECNQPDTCNGAGACLSNFLPNGTGCTSNGMFCDGMESCQNGACVPSGVNPCLTQFNPKNCDEAGDTCFTCSSSTQCGDGNPCTADACSPSGLCLHSPAAPGAACGMDPNCDTLRTCAGGQCVGAFTPNGTPCADDGDVCTFDECQSGVCAHLPAEFAQPCGPDDCNCNEVYDLCEIEEGSAEDCNANDIPDECERPVYSLDSGNLSPIGDGFPQIFMATGLPEALDDVTLTLSAQADLFSAAEWIDVSINGQFAHRFFTVIGFDCANSPDVEAIVLTAAQFNGMVAGGAVDFVLTASAQVRADLCTPDSYVRVRLEYMAPGEGDCDGNSVPDECDLAADPANDCNGNELLDACEIADGTASDCNVNGVLDECDRGDVCEMAVLSAEAGNPDNFGFSVSKHGRYMLIGAPGTACNVGARCGAAYIAVLGTDGASKLQELPRPIDEAGAEFGVAVAIHDNWALVGARYQSCDNTPNCGAAYVYARTGENWYLLTALQGSQVDIGDRFGSSVAIDGDVAVIGAIYEECVAIPPYSCGAAYVFQYNGASWIEEGILHSSVEHPVDWFGSAVDIDGNVIVVGAQFANCPGSMGCGGSVVYRYNGASWIEEGILTPSVTDSGGFAGFSVAVSGNTVVAGAPYAPCVDGTPHCGIADVYQFDGVNWNQAQTLRSPRASQSDYFGRAVSASSYSIAVAAPFGNCKDSPFDCGDVFIYEKVQGTWIEQYNIQTPDTFQSNMFGSAVSLDETEVLIGANHQICIDCGLAYVYAHQTQDCNCNAMPDACEITDGLAEDCNANRIPDECELEGGSLNDVDPADGVPDECVMQFCNDFSLANPTNCDLDSAQPFDPANPDLLQGWTVFDLNLPPNCPLAGLSLIDFEISVIPADVSAPLIEHIVPVAGMLRVVFDGPISPAHWTCITLVQTGKTQCVAFLPGDVSGGSHVSIGDIYSILIGLSVPEFSTEHRFDVDRSGTLTAEDLVVLLDLLNGAGAFDPWLEQTIPSCPTVR